MAKVSSKELYEFKKTLKELANKRGRGTELVSVYIPPTKQLSDVPGALEPPKALVHSADKALYKAKANGQNIVCTSAIKDNVAQI